MKETLIIFTTENVRAILEDRKTQTRRVIKKHPLLGIKIEPWHDLHKLEVGYNLLVDNCPYGQVGDRLWVGENYSIAEVNWRPARNVCHALVLYKAGGTKGVKWNEWLEDNWLKPDWDKNRPSIHMFRWASRITLEITGVRVERLQEINYWDAGKEGLDDVLPEWMRLAEFRKLWNSINAKPKPHYIKGKIVFYESYPWEDIQETRIYRGKPWYIHGNPWVWVIEFRRLTDA